MTTTSIKVLNDFLSQNIQFNTNSLSYNDNGKKIELNKNNILLPQNSRYKNILATSYAEINNERLTLLSWLESTNFSENNNNEIKLNRLYQDYPNLMPLFNLFKKDLPDDFMSNDNWINLKSNDVPFGFNKKADFNFFKTLPENIIKHLIHNYFLFKNNKSINSIALLCSGLNFVNQKRIDWSIHEFANFLFVINNFLNNLQAQINSYNLNNKEQEKTLNFFFGKENRLNIMFSLIYDDWLNNKEQDKDVIKARFEMYNEMFLLVPTFYFLKEYDSDYANIDNKIINNIHKQKDFVNVVMRLQDNKEIISEIVKEKFSNELFVSDKQKVGLMLNYDIDVFDETLVMFPIITDSQFVKESAFMSNCVQNYKSSVMLNYFINSKDKDAPQTFDFYFHIAEIADGKHIPQNTNEIYNLNTRKHEHYTLHLTINIPTNKQEWQQIFNKQKHKNIMENLFDDAIITVQQVKLPRNQALDNIQTNKINSIIHKLNQQKHLLKLVVSDK